MYLKEDDKHGFPDSREADDKLLACLKAANEKRPAYVVGRQGRMESPITGKIGSEVNRYH